VISYIKPSPANAREAFGQEAHLIYTQEQGDNLSRVASVIGFLRGATEVNKTVGGNAATQQILAYDGYRNTSVIQNSKVNCPEGFNPLVPVSDGQGHSVRVPAQTSTSRSPAYVNPYFLTLRTGAGFEAFMKVTAN
jgi:hypothetical protein